MGAAGEAAIEGFLCLLEGGIGVPPVAGSSDGGAALDIAFRFKFAMAAVALCALEANSTCKLR